MANPFVHVELNTNDVAKAKGFYSKMFDWKMEDMKMDWGTYTIISVGEGTGGGLMENPIPNAPSFWLSYVLVDDIEAATKKAKSLGGKVMIFPNAAVVTFIVLMPIFLTNVPHWLGLDISVALQKQIELMIFGGLILFFLIVEPHGLARPRH